MIAFKDLTLREGAQTPGLEIDEATGRRVVEQLAALDVSCAELAFPRAAPRASWYRRADELGLRTAALARATAADVEAALAVEPDEVELLVTSSDVQLEHVLGESRAAARERLVEHVELAREGGVAVGVSLMDAVRADEAFLVSCARAAADAGAKHVTLADTTGSGLPADVAETVAAVVEAVGDELDVVVHTHDDMGVAAANAVAGVAAGAASVDATVGGVGERAGNAPLEQVAVLLAERGDDPALALEELIPASRGVLDALGVEVPPDSPVVGDRVHRHESGLHTAAMLAEPRTFEAFDPASYGGERELLFGAHTGRGAARELLADAGVEPTEERVARVLGALAAAAEERGGPLGEAAARALVERQMENS